MSRARKNPPAPGVYCDATTTRYQRQCSDPAVFIVWWNTKDTGDSKQEGACGAHLGKLITMRMGDAEFSREMFRVVPWEVAMAESQRMRGAEESAA